MPPARAGGMALLGGAHSETRRARPSSGLAERRGEKPSHSTGVLQRGRSPTKSRNKFAWREGQRTWSRRTPKRCAGLALDGSDPSWAIHGLGVDRAQPPRTLLSGCRKCSRLRHNQPPRRACVDQAPARTRARRQPSSSRSSRSSAIGLSGWWGSLGSTSAIALRFGYWLIAEQGGRGLPLQPLSFWLTGRLRSWACCDPQRSRGRQSRIGTRRRKLGAVEGEDRRVKFRGMRSELVRHTLYAPRGRLSTQG